MPASVYSTWRMAKQGAIDKVIFICTNVGLQDIILSLDDSVLASNFIKKIIAICLKRIAEKWN